MQLMLLLRVAASTATLVVTTAASSLSTYKPIRHSPDEFDWETLTPSRALRFSPCYSEFECARLLVPLDWNEADAEARQGRTMTLALTRLPANMTSAAPSEADAVVHGGTLIVNPGGPGDSGTVEMLKNGHYLRDLVASKGKRFSVLSFDPRGMGFSTPRADCFAGEEAGRAIFAAQMNGANEAVVDGDDRDEVLAVQRALARAHAEKCKTVAGEGYIVQEFMGTASVARDMLLIVDELEKLRVEQGRKPESSGHHSWQQGSQKKLSGKGQYNPGEEDDQDALPRLLYFGTSYGTMLGNTFISMFPGRVERMILDGNVVPEDYAAGDWSGNVVDAEKVIAQFYDACFAAKSACALYDASADTSPSSLRAKIDALVVRLTKSPLVISGGKNVVPTILKGSDLLGFFADPMYDPIGGSAILAATLADAIAGNYTALIATSGLLAKQDGTCDAATTAEYRWMAEANAAVRCGDGADLRNTTNDDWRDQLKHARKLSPQWANLWMSVECLEWQVRPNWRFTGPFGSPAPASAGEKTTGRPSVPVLFLASRFDPATPLVSSVKAKTNHAESRLVVQNTFGHCATLSAPSECTKRIVSKYMDTGEMPEEGTECEGDCKPFEECPYLRMVLPR